jgi:uncharacterized protein (DUF1330 family)
VPAYVVFIHETTNDPDALAEYERAVVPILATSPVRFLAAGGKVEALEGPLPEGITISVFPTMEDARAWFANPSYQAAARHRQHAGMYRGFILEGR